LSEVPEGAGGSDEESRLIFVGGAYRLNPYLTLVAGATINDDWGFGGGIAIDARILSRIGLGSLLAEEKTTG
jgi:hypothetical protein